MNAIRTYPIKGLTCTAVAALGLVVVLGCGDDTGLAKRYPVSGTVKYNGQPVEKGQINFIATDKVNQRDANGFIENGHYILTTAKPGDGALPGDYGVVITAIQTDDSKVIETVVKQGGGGRQQDIAKAHATGKLLVPPKYQLPETSGLKATVKTESNTFDFNLTD